MSTDTQRQDEDDEVRMTRIIGVCALIGMIAVLVALSRGCEIMNRPSADTCANACKAMARFSPADGTCECMP